MGLEDDFLKDDLDDEKTIEYIKNYLPQELKEKYSDDELYYFLDLIDEYYSESGILDAKPDEDGCIEVDLGQIVDYIIKEAHKDEMGEYDPEEILFVVQGSWNIRSHWMMMKNKKFQLSKREVRTACSDFFCGIIPHL